MRSIFSGKNKKEIDFDKVVEDIGKLIKDIPLQKRLGLLAYIINKDVGANLEEPMTKILLDSLIYEVLKNQYTPQGMLFHLSVIAGKVTQDYPNVMNKLKQSEPKINNGVV